MIGLTTVTACPPSSARTFVADRRQRAVLDFDEPVAANHVDPVAAKRHFEAGPGSA